eukprot:TRINITY_DN4864_c0_g1_i1.p1 TRINITY_DN4864_c0_g1~~TRINITY_DN4864_c0_g1_i1.p1  ORF type:complete len:650 (-),score=139.57 TRINITY_DN4864_c0_g1_i1:30-1979(-)
MVLYNFKRIQVVPNGKDFVDILLSRTQRKTPTVIHKHYAIPRIRQFYMRKVKYTAQTAHDKLAQIINDFPIIDDIHPFYADLMNVLYDKDHYKLALSQINTCKHLIDTLAKDYVRLLKYGDSLYRCKQLKRAALGRIATLVKKQTSSLAYLEQVRQHLSRLPTIDPATRTLLVTGYPNVGKSSFMNKVTRANVEVQPYAFTTKSLFVGHTDYKYLRWQVIDTPGILDHPLEDSNTIEMQSITALAHLRCIVLFFIDISEECGYTVQQQVGLFKSIRPLFTNKPLLLVLNKIDKKKPEDLSPEDKASIDEIVRDNPAAGQVEVVSMSTLLEINVNDVKEKACQVLLHHRNEIKLQNQKPETLLSRIHLAMPELRDNVPRPPVIPETLGLSTKEISKQRLEEIQSQLALYEEFDPEWTGIDWRRYYLLENFDWNFDKVPEIIEGKNIADFLTDDIEVRLQQLEKEEEERLLALEKLMDEEDGLYQFTDEELDKIRRIREKKKLLMLQHKLLANKRKIPRTADTKNVLTTTNLNRHLSSLGIDTEQVIGRVRSTSRHRSQSRDASKSRSASQSRSGRKRTREERSLEKFKSLTPKPGEGLKTVQQKERAVKLFKKARLAFSGLPGESDRRIPNLMPKHLFAGKRSIGKNERR